MNVIFNFELTAVFSSQLARRSSRPTGNQVAQQGDFAGVHPQGDDCRCLCGNLLARVVEGRVELKCRRCKRTLLVPLARGRRAAAMDWELAPPRKAGAP